MHVRAVWANNELKQWMPSQPIARCTTPCSSCNVMDSGTRTRRQLLERTAGRRRRCRRCGQAIVENAGNPEQLAAVLDAARTADAGLVVIDTAPQVSAAALEAARAADTPPRNRLRS